MKRKLFLLLCALLTMIGVQAQGTWTAPAVPGVDPSTVDGTTTYYLYNVESDAFVAYGMSWQSQAIARRLCNGDQAASDMHKMTASISDSKLSFHFNDVKDANRLLSDNSGENNCYVDTWTGNATKFTYAATTTSGAYTLTNVETGHELDVHWKYGGHLTGTNGQGFTAWAIIPETSITNGSYAKYKEKKQMYRVYQALVAAGVVSSYTTALETANAVYVNNSSTVSQLRTATRTLINAAAEDIASSINGNSLFDDTDIWGNQALTTWTSTAASNSDYGEYETYNIHYDFDQTHDVPNGSYKIIFHSLFRNDGGGTAPRIIVTDGEKDGGGTNASANVPLFTSFDFTPTNNNSSGNMSVAKSGYFSDWVQNNNVWIPNGRRSSADAMAHTGAVASVDNFKVTTGKMNIRLIIDQDNQWVNFQGFDIIFYGSTTGKLYRDLVELLETANALATQPMNATVLNDLNSAIAAYSNLSKSSSEEDLEAAIAAVTTANTNAETSISIYSSIEAAITEYATKASTLDDAGQAAYDDSGVVAKYNNGTYETFSEAEAELSAAYRIAVKAQTTNGADMTDAIVNHSFEDGEYTVGWTSTPDGDTGRKLNSNATYTITNPDGDYIFNTWSHGYPLTQNIGTLRAGYYKLSATVASDGATLYLLANNTHPATGAKTTDKKVGLTAEYLFYLSESTDNVNIGVVGCNGDYAEGGSWWYKADNFRLTYYSSLPDAPTAVDGVMKSSIATAQSNAISAYNSSKTVENYNAAAAAVTEAEASVAAYANAKTYLEKVEELLATTRFYSPAAYNGVYNTYKTAYDERTLDNVTGRDLSYKVAGSGGTQRYDSNTANDLLIPGWKIGETDATTSGSGFYINTWSTEGNTDGSNLTTPFYEYWTGNASALTATNLVAKISGYKAETNYRISALVRVQQQNGQTKANDDLTFKVGSGTAVNAADGTQIGEMYFYKTVIATGASDAEGNLTVTFNVKEGNHISWVAFKNITVEELASDRETNLLFNADFEEPYTVYANSGVIDDRAIYVPNGWTVKDATFNTNDMTIFNSGDKASSNFSSITALPSGGNNTFLYRGKWGNETSFDVSQNITLPAGTYKLSCDAWKSGLGGDGVIFAGTNTVSLSGNEESWRPLSLEFTLNEETPLNVGFRVIHNNDGSEKFIGFDNFGLYTVNKVDEDEAYTPVDKAAHSVIVKRTMKVGINTVVFPFSMTQAEVEEYFGTGSVVYQLSSYDEETETIHFTTISGISANVPCLVKATSTEHSASNYELTDRTLVSGTPTYAGEGVTMTGSYAAIITVDEGNYIISGSNIYLVNSDNVKMKNTRAYISVSGSSSARLNLVIDGEETAINALEATEAEAEGLKDGKYFIGGKIVLVKNGVKYGANGQKLN